MIDHYLCEKVIRPLVFSLWNDIEHKLDQKSHILETEGAETKLILHNILFDADRGERERERDY